MRAFDERRVGLCLVEAENKSSETFAEYKQQRPRGFGRTQCDGKHMAEQ